ncbi:MAG: CBS domain-containing protein [Planctomycetaceae bacterium]|nr:CBS domain-containing protein [Planctomycetaceae bacterium]
MGLRENTQTEPVKTLNLRTPILVGKDATLRQCIEKMRDGKLGCVIVVDADQKPVGLFTEAMLRHLLLDSPVSLNDPIESRMATAYPWCRLTDPVETVLEAMELKNHRFVVVVDETGQIAGLTGQKGLMEYVAEQFPQEVMVQRVGTKPFPEQREGA